MVAEVLHTETYRIKIGRPSPMIGAKWCRPVGWVPANQIPGSVFADGFWQAHGRETVGLVYFTGLDEGEEIEVPIDDLGLAGRGEWRLLGDVLPAVAATK